MRGHSGIRLRGRGRTAAIAIAVAALATLSLAAAFVPSSRSAYVASIKNSTDTAATASYFTCAAAFTADAGTALYELPLNEGSNSLFATNSANILLPGTYQGNMTTSTTTPLACPRDTGGAYVLNGTTSYVSTGSLQSSPASFTLEVWFKTTQASGRLMGFGNLQTGSSSQYDRHLYMTTAGGVTFGTYNGGYDTITSPATTYADGNWHQAVATFSASTGMLLYMDGALVASNSSYTVAEAHTGYWRIGYDNLSGWPGTGTNYFFKGSMRFAAVYTSVLTAAQIKNHWAAGQ